MGHRGLSKEVAIQYKGEQKKVRHTFLLITLIAFLE